LEEFGWDWRKLARYNRAVKQKYVPPQGGLKGRRSEKVHFSYFRRGAAFIFRGVSFVEIGGGYLLIAFSYERTG
jgi:hypothetical protein